jgi:hypothetical protein
VAGDSGTALVVVDVLNPYQHDDAERLAESGGTPIRRSRCSPPHERVDATTGSLRRR